MTQITRCPVCQTMFKVVADQVNAAQGWVRCGCCGEVFDSALHQMPMIVTDVEVALPLSSVGADTGPVVGAPTDLIQVHQVNQVNQPHQTFTDETPAAQPVQAVQAIPITPQAAFATEETTGEASAIPEVSFVRDARRKAFWKKSLVRGFLGLLSLALLTVLFLQWVLQQKDNLAAMDSRLVPFLQTLCASLECEIRPPRRIESVVIDSSNFSKTSPDVYHLSFVLKNTSAIKLEIPSVEITLTDAQDQALVRRVLTPAQFGATSVALAAHAELTGSVILKASADEATSPSALAAVSMPASASASAPSALPTPASAMLLPINGYRILAFYP